MPGKSLLVESGGGPPMVPMIDLIMTLLIFFMLVTHYLPPSLTVNLPEASAAVPEDSPAVTLSILTDGTLAVDGEEFQWEALPRLLEGRDPETRVRISADKQVDYDYIIRAMNAAAEAGLPRIVLETLPGGTT